MGDLHQSFWRSATDLTELCCWVAKSKWFGIPQKLQQADVKVETIHIYRILYKQIVNFYWIYLFITLFIGYMILIPFLMIHVCQEWHDTWVQESPQLMLDQTDPTLTWYKVFPIMKTIFSNCNKVSSARWGLIMVNTAGRVEETQIMPFYRWQIGRHINQLTPAVWLQGSCVS